MTATLSRRAFFAFMLLPALLAAWNGGWAMQVDTAPGTAKATLDGDSAHPGEARGWIETELFFGLGPADAHRAGVSEAAWRRFLDTEVTPRFPAGLSVMDVYGQWQSKAKGVRQHGIGRIRSKMLLIAYAPTAENASRIEAIRTAWKLRTGDQSVLKVTLPVDVSF